jgi:pimeloyl-ACP methyl ester carboxylesterase
MQRHRVDSYARRDLVFDVTDSGPLDGPVVVLLHGFPSNRGGWAAVAAELNAAGVRTVAPDQRGYSPAAAPQRRRDYRATLVVDDTIALIGALGVGPVHVVGHDWGGFVVWALRDAATELLSGATVLSTPHPRAMLRSLLSSAQLARSAYIGFFQLPTIPERVLLPRLARLLRASGLPGGTADDYAEFMARPGRLRTALNWYRGMWLPPRQSAPSVASGPPTTFLWGARDPFLGRRAAMLTRRFAGPGYRFVELDADHWLPETHAAIVARQILADLGAKPGPAVKRAG